MSTEQNTNTAVSGWSALNVQLDVDNAQLGISAGTDFENNTWTFEMPDGFKAGAGGYMIIKVAHNAGVKR
jgi:hypothetical protein